MAEKRRSGLAREVTDRYITHSRTSSLYRDKRGMPPRERRDPVPHGDKVGALRVAGVGVGKG
jgi:hypothetical protein